MGLHMLDIGFPELLITLSVAVIVIGPKKLPEIARTLGKGIAEFRRISDDLKMSLLMEDRHIQNPPTYPPRKEAPSEKPLTSESSESVQESSSSN